jgi:hypothetical protein
MTERIVLTDALLERTLQARTSNRVNEDALVDEIVRELAGMGQTRAGRWTRISRPARLLAAASIALVAVVVFVIVGPGSRPSILELPVAAAGTAGDVLAAGRYRSAVFAPGLMLTVPDRRWAASANLPAELQLRAVRPGQSVDDSGRLTVLRIDNVMTGACGYGGNVRSPIGSGDAQAFVTWLQGQLPANLGTPSPVAIAGRAGLEVELRPSTELKQACDFGFLLTDVGPDANPTFVEIPIDGRRVRIAAIDVSGTLVVVLTAGAWTSEFGDVISDADAVIASMTFE